MTPLHVYVQFSQHRLWKAILFPLNGIRIPVDNYLIMYVKVYVWAVFHSSDLSLSLGFMPIPPCLDTIVFLVNFEVL